MSDNPILETLPEELHNHPIAPIPADTMIRMAALGMAVRYCGDNVIKDGTMYQQLKLDGKPIKEGSHDLVLQSAVAFERYLRGDYQDLVDELVYGDFDAWLRMKVREAKMRDSEPEETGPEPPKNTDTVEHPYNGEQKPIETFD